LKFILKKENGFDTPKEEFTNPKHKRFSLNKTNHPKRGRHISSHSRIKSQCFSKLFSSASALCARLCPGKSGITCRP